MTERARIIDINADMGEYADVRQRDEEAALMPHISSCSIACGGHAGDEKTMRETLRLAKRHGLKVGAHPAYPDRAGFGRRTIVISLDELRRSLEKQIAALREIAEEEGLTLTHLKSHGALYNDCARDASLARLIAGTAEDTALFGPPDSALEDAAKAAGRKFIREGFADRLYHSSGALAPRAQPGAVLETTSARAAQAVCLARGENVTVADGQLSICVETICLHSDSPDAAASAPAIRAALETAGFTIRAYC